MSGGNFADDYTLEEVVDVWGQIVSVGRICNKFAEESGRAPSGKEMERILSVAGAIASVPANLKNCLFSGCGKALNTHNQLGFCGACQSALIDEENSPRRAELLSFLRQEYPDLFGKAVRTVPWKITLAV